MKQMELYHKIQQRDPIAYDSLQPGNRIALRHEGELDIMKIAIIGYAGIAGDRVAVALVCPGQASFRMRDNGDVYLNQLQTPQRTIYTRSKPWLVQNLGTDATEDALSGYRKAYWVSLPGNDIVKLSQREMSFLQEPLRELLPEVFRK